MRKEGFKNKALKIFWNQALQMLKKCPFECRDTSCLDRKIQMKSLTDLVRKLLDESIVQRFEEG